ncbi:MAG TPA: ABC transporter ATP-binding protein [Candidatus Limnocylindrales bacterium]|nr:ABC transporter ATP-binding protein [Candidatus Limnocylindrales bacterium]
MISQALPSAVEWRVQVQNVSKEFPPALGSSTLAISNVSFEVRNHEFLTIVGPSGCGKSTLLNILAGLAQPTAGTILVDGVEHARRTPFFGYMFQKDLLLPWRTIVDNVALGLEVQGVSKAEARREALRVLERFKLARFGDRYPVQLSVGMRQRVALMRTLVCDRPVLLLDEPFGALDALTRSVMQEWLLETWMVERRTVIFITHDIDESIFLSDRVLIMSSHPGRIKGEFRVPFARPRTHECLATPEFTELKRYVLDQLYDESVKAFQDEA